MRNCNKSAQSCQFDAVVVNGANAKAVNLTVVSCGSVQYTYSGSGDDKSPSYGLYVVSGQAVNCVVADVWEDGDPAVNRAWGGASARFLNCATDTDAAINDTCVAITTATFKSFASGDYRPASGGLLVDTGAEVQGFASLVDLGGNPRVVGKHIDVGCYECQSVPGLMIFVR